MTTLPNAILSGVKRELPLEYVLQPGRHDHRQEERRLLRFTLPPWQRDEVWDAARKRSFIEGIFLGLGTGFYVVHGQDWNTDGAPLPMSGWLLDGQQRMCAIRDFVQDEFSIFDGIRYSQIREIDKRRRFENVVFPSVEIPYQSDERVLKDLYMRLNFGGVAHTSADAQRVQWDAGDLVENPLLQRSNHSRPR